jgi:hypothetical protein
MWLYPSLCVGGKKEKMRENYYPNDDADAAAKKIANPNRKKKGKKYDEKQLPVFPTYKYSRPFLHEAVILGGLSYFISYVPRFDKIIPFETIDEPPSRTLRPPDREEYPYIPYEFADSQELLDYLRRAKAETIDSLYQKAKPIVKKYNDQDEPKLILLATDLVWSYFQD